MWSMIALSVLGTAGWWCVIRPKQRVAEVIEIAKTEAIRTGVRLDDYKEPFAYPGESGVWIVMFRAKVEFSRDDFAIGVEDATNDTKRFSEH